MKYNYKADILDLESKGLINPFAKFYLSRVSQNGMNKEFWQEALDDAISATKIGISTQEEFDLYFYIDHFAEDLVLEIFGTNLSEKEENDLKKYIFDMRNEVNFDNLLSFKVVTLKWLKAQHKMEKISSTGMSSRPSGNAPYYLKRYNMERWARIVSVINHAISFGITKKRAIQEGVCQIDDNVERLDFLAWFNFKFGISNNLYDINKKIKNQSSENLIMTKANKKYAGIYEDALSYYVDKSVFKKDDQDAKDISSFDLGPRPEEIAENREQELLRKQTFELGKNKLLSRTFSIDKLLAQFQESLGNDQVGEIEDALNALRKTVRKLTMATSVNDYVIKTASILNKNGFSKGAELLLKINTPIKKEAFENIDIDKVDDLLEKLTDVSTFLKTRAIIRDMAEVDLQLFEMGLAPLFPEITEAQSKLIDAFTSAGNKIDDIIPKIRSTSKRMEGEIHQLSTKRENSFDKKKEVKDSDDMDIPLAFPNKNNIEFSDKEPLEESKPEKDKAVQKPNENLSQKEKEKNFADKMDQFSKENPSSLNFKGDKKPLKEKSKETQLPPPKPLKRTKILQNLENAVK